MATLPIEQLAGQLEQGLQPLYLIHGEEALLRVEALDTLRAAARRHGYANREVYAPENQSDWDELLASAGSMGLFADLKLLEVQLPGGKPGKAGGEALQTLAEHLPEDTVVVVSLPKLERVQTQSKWFEALARRSVVLEAKAVDVHALPQWIRKRLQQYGLQIENEVLALFAERVEGNLLAARQEIDKLALLYPSGHVVGMDEAQDAVANVARFDVFQLAAAWMGGDAGRTARLLEGLEADGGEPVMLLGVVAEDIRTLIRLAAALKQGQQVAAVRNSLRLWGEKQQLAPKAVKRIPVPRLLSALQECARIDRLIKGAEEGEAWPAFKSLLMGLAIS